MRFLGAVNVVGDLAFESAVARNRLASWPSLIRALLHCTLLVWLAMRRVLVSHSATQNLGPNPEVTPLQIFSVASQSPSRSYSQQLMIKTLLLTAVLGMPFAAHCACPTVDDVEPEFSSVLSATMASLEVTQEQTRRSVASLGTIKNSSSGCFDDVVVEVKYFDSTHKLIDTVVKPLYGVVVSPHGETAFRVLDAAAKEKEAYASQEVRVLSAEPKFSRQKRKPTLSSTLGDVLQSWGPMILLLAIFAYFMRRVLSKNSPQARSISLLQQQVELSQAQTQHLARLATALESVSSARPDR